MPELTRAIIVSLLSLGVVAPPFTTARTPPMPCPSGRYLVDAPPLLGQGGDAGAVVTVTAGGEVEVSDLCPPAAAKRVKARRKATKVTARWEACGDLERVRLKLSVRAPECTEAIGVLKARRTKRSRIRAVRLPACVEMEPSEEAIEAAVEASLAGLVQPWSDPDELRALVTRVEVRLGCSFGWLEERTAGVAVVARAKPPEFQAYDPSVDYCGVGTSRDTFGFTMRGGSECLNQTCFTHDVCYYESCIPTQCSWSGQTKHCDDPMFDQCEALPVDGGCRGGDGWDVKDVAICKMSKGFRAAQTANPGCDGSPCEEETCNPETGECETTTTTVTSTTVTTVDPTTPTTSTSTSTVTSTTLGPLGGIRVVPRFACIAPGETLQLEALVEGVAEPTVTWTLASGYGSVDDTGLYQSLSIGVSEAVVTAEAAEVPGALDWANVHVSQCNCAWSAEIAGPVPWQAAGWYDVFLITPGSLDLLFEQDAGPSGEPRPGLLGVGFVGPTPLPGETGSYRAGFVFTDPDGETWNALQDDPDVAIHVNVEEYTGATMQGTVTGTAARRVDGEVVEVAEVLISYRGTAAFGEPTCE